MKPSLKIVGMPTHPDLALNKSPRSSRQRMPQFISLAPFIADKLFYRYDRSMPFVKVYTSLLDDDRFNTLDDVSQAHLLKIMMLIGRTGINRVTTNPQELARKINAKSPIQIELILKSKCFVPSKRIKNQQLVRATDTDTDTGVRINKHRHTETLPRVGEPSKFSYAECLAYAQHLRSEGIKNPGGYARTIQRSGEADAEIEMFLNPSRRVEPKTAKRGCPRCDGTGFERMPDGNAVRKCGCKNE